MSKRITSVLMEDLLECISKIFKYTNGMTYEEFLEDSKTREAVYRNLEVMGEAANRLPEYFKNEHEEVEWHKIIAARNVIIHHYDGIDDKIIWNIIQKNLPELQPKLKGLL